MVHGVLDLTIVIISVVNIDVKLISIPLCIVVHTFTADTVLCQSCQHGGFDGYMTVGDKFVHEQKGWDRGRWVG